MVIQSTAEPTQLGRYQIVKMLNRGATGLVYEGWDPVRQCRVAIKALDPSLLAEPDGQGLLERFRYEAKIFGSFLHRNIAILYEYNEEGSIPFIALELLEGRNLKECIEAGDCSGLERIVTLVLQLLDAVAYLHDRGVIHLDLKPANIILLAGDQIKVMDFGIAQRENGPDRWHSTVMGTPGYMSPEQLMGHTLDRRSDLFSIGVILYELLTGVKPFPGKQIPNIVQRVLNLSPDAPSSCNAQLPVALDAVVQKALAKQPVDRFQDAESFRLAIQQALPHPL